MCNSQSLVASLLVKSYWQTVYKKYLTDSGVPIEKKHVKGGGLLYGG